MMEATYTVLGWYYIRTALVTRPTSTEVADIPFDLKQTSRRYFIRGRATFG